MTSSYVASSCVVEEHEERNDGEGTGHASPPSLLLLVDDVIWTIVRHLDYKDRCSLGLTCHRLHSLVKSHCGNLTYPVDVRLLPLDNSILSILSDWSVAVTGVEIPLPTCAAAFRYDQTDQMHIFFQGFRILCNRLPLVRSFHFMLQISNPNLRPQADIILSWCQVLSFLHSHVPDAKCIEFRVKYGKNVCHKHFQAAPDHPLINVVRRFSLLVSNFRDLERFSVDFPAFVLPRDVEMQSLRHLSYSGGRWAHALGIEIRPGFHPCTNLQTLVVDWPCCTNHLNEFTQLPFLRSVTITKPVPAPLHSAFAPLQGSTLTSLCVTDGQGFYQREPLPDAPNLKRLHVARRYKTDNLSSYTRLTHLHLDGCLDTNPISISLLPHLRHLSIVGCEGVTDLTPLHQSNQITSLELRSLSYLTSLGDRPGFFNLRKLKFSNCNMVKCAESLRGCSKVTELCLVESLSRVGVVTRILSEFRGVQRLSVQNCVPQVTETLLEVASEKLGDISIVQTSLPAISIRGLTHCRHLKSLCLEGIGIPAPFHFIHLPYLASVTLDSLPIRSLGSEAWNLPRLRSLIVNECVSLEDLEAISGCIEVRSLVVTSQSSMPSAKWNDVIGCFTSLTYLLVDLPCSQSMALCTGVRSLQIRLVPGTNELTPLVHCQQLRYLRLTGVTSNQSRATSVLIAPMSACGNLVEIQWDSTVHVRDVSALGRIAGYVS